MSYEHPIEIEEDDVLVIAVQDSNGNYFMWQKGLTEEVGSGDGVYFEYDDQINGGHNIVVECTIDRDGMHVVLADRKMEHFYFPSDFNKYDELKGGLLKIYKGNEDVLEFHDF
ncbi:MAG: hypothetical protein OQJ89_06305 [Kangiellaceae bacterium]|nr:hypothetical protein [Kangiellaceae bacterium]MCW8999482.1 hypothetical protein [Kangiellaceae bacterium]MCW9016554.1 hypothetical protein [Kangiellaceae bacterium]